MIIVFLEYGGLSKIDRIQECVFVDMAILSIILTEIITESKRWRSNPFFS